MTYEEHRLRHLQLHACLDELFADYIRHHPKEHTCLKTPIEKLITWSYEQSMSPSDAPGTSENPTLGPN